MIQSIHNACHLLWPSGPRLLTIQGKFRADFSAFRRAHENTLVINNSALTLHKRLQIWPAGHQLWQ